MRETEHLSRLYVAYQFVLAEETKAHSADVLKEMEGTTAKYKEEIVENEKAVKELSKEIAEMEKKRDQVRTVKTFSQLLIQVIRFHVKYSMFKLEKIFSSEK